MTHLASCAFTFIIEYDNLHKRFLLNHESFYDINSSLCAHHKGNRRWPLCKIVLVLLTII